MGINTVQAHQTAMQVCKVYLSLVWAVSVFHAAQGLLLDTLLDAVAPSDGADICHGLDCPKYTVLNSTQAWELRRYEASKWAATNATAMHKDEVNSQMFQKLFQFISGNNKEATKIAMTAPVLTTIIHGAGPNCRSEYTMHFMIPFAHQAKPPTPSDPDVFLVDQPAMDVFVGSFGGWARDQNYIDALGTLSQAVAQTGDSVREDFFFEAGYDGPYTFRNRHNEVWLVKN